MGYKYNKPRNQFVKLCTICTNNHQQFQQFVLFIGFELHVNFITFKWALQNILYLNSKMLPNLNGDDGHGGDMVTVMVMMVNVMVTVMVMVMMMMMLWKLVGENRCWIISTNHRWYQNFSYSNFTRCLSLSLISLVMMMIDLYLYSNFSKGHHLTLKCCQTHNLQILGPLSPCSQACLAVMRFPVISCKISCLAVRFPEAPNRKGTESGLATCASSEKRLFFSTISRYSLFKWKIWHYIVVYNAKFTFVRISLRMDLEKCSLESNNVSKIWISVFLLLALMKKANIFNNLFFTIVLSMFAFGGVNTAKQSWFEIRSGLNGYFHSS